MSGDINKEIKTGSEVSGADDYIKGLIAKGEALMVPDFLRDRGVESEFHLGRGDTLTGYEASDNGGMVDLKRQRRTAAGDWVVSHVGPVRVIHFRDKASKPVLGVSSYDFLTIARIGGGSMAFIIDKE